MAEIKPMNTAPSKMLMNVYVMNSQTLTQGHDDIERDLKPCTETEIGLGMDDWTLRPLWLLTLKSKFCCAWPFNDVPADIWKKRAGTTPMKGVPIGVRTKICTFRVPPPQLLLKDMMIHELHPNLVPVRDLLYGQDYMIPISRFPDPQSEFLILLSSYMATC